ncbi:MAG: hypothetical protein JW987_03830 [Anaerolineaceae bacterium]|nr:hypothetical protein [Anaerolineaceae bacterium]
MDSDQEDFLRYWFSGYANALEQMDESAQDTLLRACGLACGRSYTFQAFAEAYARSANLDEFLLELAQVFPASRYERVTADKIKVSIAQCSCDLVRLGWVKSPIQCKCSVYNLQQNFAHALQKTVQVRLLSSILGGAETCEFEVILSS